MTTTTNDDDNTVVIETLLNWGRENGIRTHPNVAIQQRILKNGDEDERGIFYVRLDDERDDVNDDATTTTTETLVSIPEKALL